MRGEGLRLAVWCDAGGDFALPITSSYHDLLFMLQRYAVFLYLQGLYFSTSTRCIKMGISSLKSVILYSFSLYFHYCHVERSRDISWHRTNITEILTIVWTWNAGLLLSKYGQMQKVLRRLSLSRMILKTNQSMEIQYEMKRTWSIETPLQRSETATRCHAMQ